MTCSGWERRGELHEADIRQKARVKLHRAQARRHAHPDRVLLHLPPTEIFLFPSAQPPTPSASVLDTQRAIAKRSQFQTLSQYSVDLGGNAVETALVATRPHVVLDVTAWPRCKQALGPSRTGLSVAGLGRGMQGGPRMTAANVVEWPQYGNNTPWDLHRKHFRLRTGYQGEATNKKQERNDAFSAEDRAKKSRPFVRCPRQMAESVTQPTTLSPSSGGPQCRLTRGVA